jgi:hypothetical protein
MEGVYEAGRGGIVPWSVYIEEGECDLIENFWIMRQEAFVIFWTINLSGILRDGFG